MNPEEIYISQVLAKLPAGPMRAQIALELRSHIADRVERGHPVEEAIRQLGDPAALAESYLSAVPLVSAPHLRRAAAKLVDLIIPIAFTIGWTAMAVFRLLPLAESGGSFSKVLFAYAPAALLLGGLGLNLIYLAVAESQAGQTLGKRLFGLRVVTESGARIGLGQAFVRQIPILLQVFMIDAAFALFTDRRQRAFELLTKTRVVDVREARGGERVAKDTPIPAAL